MHPRILCTEGVKKSLSAKLLAQALTQRLGRKVWRSLNSKPKQRNLKYGHSRNKLEQFQWFTEQGLSTLEFTTSQEQVQTWLQDGKTVFGRKLLNSSCGKGIVVLEPGTTTIPPCPVYTLYKPKKREFRVHVFQNTVVAVTEKKLRSNYEGPRDTKIRNLANGYVFVQSVQNEPAGLRELALQAAQVSPSDFRGVDIGFNEKQNCLFVIEVNSAPGIQGSNINAYCEAILS